MRTRKKKGYQIFPFLLSRPCICPSSSLQTPHPLSAVVLVSFLRLQPCLPDPGIKHVSPASQVDSFPPSYLGSPHGASHFSSATESQLPLSLLHELHNSHHCYFLWLLLKLPYPLPTSPYPSDPEIVETQFPLKEDFGA